VTGAYGLLLLNLHLEPSHTPAEQEPTPIHHLGKTGGMKNTEYKVNGSDTHQHLGAKSLWGLACCQVLPSSVP